MCVCVCVCVSVCVNHVKVSCRQDTLHPHQFSLLLLKASPFPHLTMTLFFVVLLFKKGREDVSA